MADHVGAPDPGPRSDALIGAAIGAAAIGAVAIGAFAIGVLAIRRLIISRVVIEHAEFKSLKIGDLSVARMRAGDVTVSGSLTLPEGATAAAAARATSAS